jgi:hypothetical protein
MTHQTVQFLTALGKDAAYIRSWVGKGYADVANLYKGQPGRAYNVRCNRAGDDAEHMRWDASQWDRMVLELARQNSADVKPSKSFPFQDGGWVPYAIINSGGHKKDEITKCHALFLEFDAPVTKEEARLKLAAFPLPVSALIESRAGLHAYWFVETTPRLWQQFQWRLIEYFESDKGIADYSRCMRLPGFYHLKEGAEPFLVNLEECHADRRYKLEDFDNILPEVPEWRLKLDRVAKSQRSFAPLAESGEEWDIRNFKHVLSHYRENSRREWDTCQCPVHAVGGGHSPDSLHINNQTGAFHCWQECSPKDIYNAINALAGWQRPKAERTQPTETPWNPPTAALKAEQQTTATAAPISTPGEKLDYDEILDQVDLLEEAITDDGLFEFTLQNFAFDNGLAKRGFNGSKLRYMSQIRRDGGSDLVITDARAILEKNPKPQWLIAGLLPKGCTVVLAANGGSGKTTLLYDFAKNIATGTAWSGYPTEKGKCLMVQADEPEVNIAQKLKVAQYGNVEWGMVDFIENWRFSQFRQLAKRVKSGGYSFVMIDSWTATHAGLGIDLTKSNAGDNVYKLRDLAAETGATIVIVHHLNKMGDLRDSSAILDNVSEVWKLHTGKETDKLPKGQRILSIGKSRSDLSGDYLLEQNASDYSWTHLGPVECPDSSEGLPLLTQVLDTIRVNPTHRFTVKEVSEHLRCDYAKANDELQRLVRFGLVESEYVVYQKAGCAASGFWKFFDYQVTQKEPQTAEEFF